MLIYAANKMLFIAKIKSENARYLDAFESLRFLSEAPPINFPPYINGTSPPCVAAIDMQLSVHG